MIGLMELFDDKKEFIYVRNSNILKTIDKSKLNENVVFLYEKYLPKDVKKELERIASEYNCKTREVPSIG